jgi:sugar phosphate permease
MTSETPDEVAHDSSPRPSSVRFLVLASACVLAVITYLHRVGFATASAEFREPLGLDQSHLGDLMAAFMIAYGVFEVPWGLFGDKFGVKNLLACVVLGGSLTTAAIALVVFLPKEIAWIVGYLLIIRFLFGAFQAGTFPAISRMLADWMPTSERGTAQGMIWTSSRLGGALAPLVLIPLFQAVGEWRTPLVILAVLGIFWLVSFRPWFRDRPESMPMVNVRELEIILAGRSRRPSALHSNVPWRAMARSRSVWALCLMYGTLGYSGNFFITLLPDYLKTYRGVDDETRKWLTSLPFACGVAACLIGGVLSDLIIRRTKSKRWGRRIVGLTGTTLGAVAILLTLQVQNTFALGVLLCLTLTGNDLAMAPSWAAAADIGEEFTGTLSGLMNMTASFAGAIAAVATGRLFKAGYLTAPFLLFAIMYVIGTFSWFWVNTNSTLKEKEQLYGLAPAE